MNFVVYLDKIYNAICNREQIQIVYNDFEKTSNKTASNRYSSKPFKTTRMLPIKSIPKCPRKKNCLSSSSIASSVVPEGATISPLQFNVFIIDIFRLSEPLLFADDGKFISPRNSGLNFQDELKDIYQWSVDKRMSFNLDKCAQLSISSTSNESFTFSGRSLKNLNQEKDLGVILSNNNSLIPHLKQRASKALKVL